MELINFQIYADLTTSSAILLAEVEALLVRRAGEVEAIVGAEVEPVDAKSRRRWLDGIGEQKLLQLWIQRWAQTHF